MTLQQLRYIAAIAKKRNMTRAAEGCFVSQSTLSQAIQDLEQRFNVKIFKRRAVQGNSTELTPFGESIISEVQEAIIITDRIKQKLREAGYAYNVS